MRPRAHDEVKHRVSKGFEALVIPFVILLFGTMVPSRRASQCLSQEDAFTTGARLWLGLGQRY